MLRAVEERGRVKQLSTTQAGGKLFKLIEWEILLVDVMEFLHQWPKSSNSGRYYIHSFNYNKKIVLNIKLVV